MSILIFLRSRLSLRMLNAGGVSVALQIQHRGGQYILRSNLPLTVGVFIFVLQIQHRRGCNILGLSYFDLLPQVPSFLWPGESSRRWNIILIFAD